MIDVHGSGSRGSPVASEHAILEADWDKEAGAWVADSDEVTGLTTEAGTVEALITKLKRMIPELLELNGVPRQGEVAFKVLIRRFDTAQRAVA